MLKTSHLGAYRDLILLFTKYGRRDFRLTLDPQDMVVQEEDSGAIEPDVKQRAEAFARQLKQLGSTYVKFGQLLSTRPDIVPKEYIEALETLQDQIEPFSFAEVERTIEEELGGRISKMFESFDATPIAAASLGQVHRAMLRDGREVVVKVQRPNVREQVRKDLEVFSEIAHALESHTELGRKMNLVGVIEQARLALLSELNYVQEARNMETLRTNLAEFPQIYIPIVIHDFSSSRVLTTELIKGRKVSKLTPLRLIDANYAELADVLTRAYLKQICIDGFWHCDPHPGNVFIPDGEGEPQIILLDFGMVSRISQEFQDEVIKLLLNISSNRGTETAEACVRMSEPLEAFDTVRFVHDISMIVSAMHDVSPQDVNTGQLLFNVISVANNNALKVPPELAMLAKTLLHLDAITKKLDPEYDPQRVIREYAEEMISKKLVQKLNPRNFYASLLDLNQLVQEFPRRAREIVDLTAAGKLTFGIKLLQAEELLSGIHKVANRITVGIIIAAIVIASALIMRTQPQLALIGYIASALIGLYLVISTILHDRKDRETAKTKAK